MKHKLLNIFTLLLAFSLPAMADGDPKDGNKPEKAAAKGNWYIEIGGGAQILFSKDASMLEFGDRITPSLSLTGGKWFSPFWGVRLQAQGFSYNGFSTANSIYVKNPSGNGPVYTDNDPVYNHVNIRPDGNYRYYLRYMNLHADFQVSLINLICGYKNTHKWDVIPAVGFGYMHTFPYKGTEKVNSISTNFSLMGKYKLPKGFDINLEAQTALMPDRFDGRLNGKPHENNFSVTIGITYNFKRKGKAAPRIYMQEKDLKESLRNIVQEELDKRTIKEVDTVIVRHETVKEVVKTTPTEPFTLAAIRFNSDQSEPIKGQDIALTNLANYLEKHPNAKFRIEGYADKQTGTPDYNLKLSMKRAMYIRNMLIDKYRIDKSRIEVQGIGTNSQPYETRASNRVALVIVTE